MLLFKTRVPLLPVGSCRNKCSVATSLLLSLDPQGAAFPNPLSTRSSLPCTTRVHGQGESVQGRTETRGT